MNLFKFLKRKPLKVDLGPQFATLETTLAPRGILFVKVNPDEEFLIVKANCMLKADVLRELRESILEQYNTGVIAIPAGYEISIIKKKDLEIDVQGKENGK